MKKKLLALLLVVALVAALAVGLVACNDGNNGESLQAIAKEDIKIGLICLHDANSTYDANFINAMYEAVDNLGLNKDTQLVIKTGIPESEQCYNTAVELVEQGCNIIFADSFGHEDHIIRAAEEYPAVRFFHATGTKAHTENLANFHNAFASIYEGRYLAGVAAGMKLVALYGDENGAVSNENAKIGYVGAYPYAEVKSGYTSFFLGVRSIVANATMEVKFTSSWYDEPTEKDVALQLIERGAKLISQHADSMGAPTACKEKNIPNVTYNISTESQCSGTYVIGSRINWAPYYEYIVKCAIENKAVGADWTGTLQTGSVEVLEIGAAAAEGTAEKLAEVKAKLNNGEIKVFDTNNFTVNGQKLTNYLADVDDAGDYVAETEAIANGAFVESYYRSAPYFDADIDGITILK